MRHERNGDCRGTDQLCYGEDNLYTDEGTGQVVYTAITGEGAWQDIGHRRCKHGRYGSDRREDRRTDSRMPSGYQTRDVEVGITGSSRAIS